MINRYTNLNTILSSNSPQYGQILDDRNLKIISSNVTIPKILTLGSDNKLLIESHIYSFTGDLIGSVYDHNFYLDSNTNSLLTDVRDVFRTANILRGSFKLVHNLLAPILGRPSHTDPENIKWPCYINEISPNRNELKLNFKNVSNLDINKFKEYVSLLINKNILNNLIINFGQNRIYKIINIRFDENDQNILYLKLLSPVHENLTELNSAWFGVEIIDSYIDTVILTSVINELEKNQLKGARFNMDVDQFDSNTTIYKSWDDLLDSNQQTSQQLIDKILNTNETISLNIDYTDFGNFIFYSSAEERIDIFYSKIEMIEKYQNQLILLETVNTTTELAADKEIINNRINSIKENFDSFERWLYYHSPESIFTHDYDGPISPWPKEIINDQYIIENGNYKNKSIQDDESINWYKNLIDYAKDYDKQNHNALIYAVPEHMLMNDNNSSFVTFVNMMGHHYDVMYSYIHALTKIHERDEHPERGPSNDLLYHIAKSFGWNLQDNNQISDLWLYKLGLDSEGGSILSNSGLPIQPHEAQTKQIWRRIVNNLPYLLKTKGTGRSIKALMSIYGIPQTLLSIKEYGGPGIDFQKPIFTENRFGYKLKLGSESYLNNLKESYLTLKQDLQYTWINGLDTGKHCKHDFDINNSLYVYPLTYEFRFSTKKNDLINNQPQLLYTIALSNEDINISTTIPYLAIILYPSEYFNEFNDSILGKIKILSFDNNPLSGTYLNVINEVTSDYLPLYDGDLWTIRINRGNTFNNSETIIPINNYGIKGYNSTELIDILLAKTSDNLYGDINHFTKLTIQNPIDSNLYSLEKSLAVDGLSTHIIFSTPSQNSNLLTVLNNNGFNDINPFLGQIQSYKSYYTYLDYSGSYDNFKYHVLNPGLYDTNDIDRGSYYSLYHYFPLGQDLQRWNHDITISGSLIQQDSFQPDRSLTPSKLIYNGFSGDQNEQYDIVNETYYISIPTLNDSYITNEKIRLESNKLKFDLSTTNKSEISAYDESGIDSNRLAVVFSIADQVNRDIFNQLGAIDIQSWIGDPESEFDNEYKDLIFNRREYFQKYTQRIDVNKFIRILSVYDYTFFEQIKQLAPARADLLTGILIEPHILEHTKSILSRKPKITNPQWKDNINLKVQKIKGLYDKIEDTINFDYEFNIKQQYLTGEAILNEKIEYKHQYLKGDIEDKFIIKGVGIQNTLLDQEDIIDVVNKYDGYKGDYYKLIDKNKPDCKFKLKNYQYNPFIYDIGNNTNIKDGWFMKAEMIDDQPSIISDNWIYTNSIDNISSFTRMDLRKVFNTFYKERFKWGINLPSNITNSLKQDIDLINIFNVTDINDLSKFISNTKILFKISAYASDSLNYIETNDIIKLNINIKALGEDNNIYYLYNEPFQIEIDKNNCEYIDNKIFIPEHLIEYTIPDLINFNGRFNHQIELEIKTENTISDMILFEVQIYNYYNKWSQEYRKMLMRETNLPSGYYLSEWYNQIEEREARNRLRYTGSKLRGAGINIDSVNTIDGGPVIEIRKTNPNSIFIKDSDDSGNIKVK